MVEHAKRIINSKIVFGLHMAMYGVIVLLNIFAFINAGEADEKNYFALVFVILFMTMAVADSVTMLVKKDLYDANRIIMIYRIVQIAIFIVYYFGTLNDVGNTVGILALLVLCVELDFFFQYDSSSKRNIGYVIIGVVTLIVTIVFMMRSQSYLQGMNVLCTAIMWMVALIVVVEIVMNSYHYFWELYVAQNRKVSQLNDANELLKEQQNEIKRTNEFLGIQKIELQAANKKINRSHDEMSVQNEVGNIINSMVEQDEMLDRICKILRVRMELDLVGVMLEPDEALYIPGAEKTDKEIYVSHLLGDSYEMKVMNRIISGEYDDLLELDNTHIRNDKIRQQRDENDGQIMESLMLIPLWKQKKKIGSLCLGKRQMNWFVDNCGFYENIATQISIGIANKRLYEQMHQMAIRDGLTHIYNRRYLTKRLDEYLGKAITKKTQVSLAMVDIDKFKQINDTYGHSCGDIAICRVATLLNQAAIRYGGIAGRYGGEEFVLAFPDKSIVKLQKIVEDIQDQIRQEEVVFEGNTIPIRVSMGIASYPETCENPAELLNRADFAMYYSKKHGRDCITVDSQELNAKI